MQMKYSITSLSQGQEVLFHLSFEGTTVGFFLVFFGGNLRRVIFR